MARKRNFRPEPPANATPQVGSPPPSARPSSRGWGWLGLAALFVYLYWFFRALPFRLYLWAYVLVPDELVQMWVGGNASRFGILDRLPLVLAVAAIYTVAGVTGWLLMRLCGMARGLTRGEVAVFSCAGGLNLWGTLILGLGLMGQLRNRGLFTGLALVLLFAAIAYGWLHWQHNVRRASFCGSTFAWGDWGWIAAMVLFSIPLLLAALLPPWYFDVREYHLQVPKEWFQRGRVDFLPHNIYGNMPLGGSIHAILGTLWLPGGADWWRGSLVGKGVIAGFAPLTAAALYVAGCRYFSRRAGILSALLFISCPWILHVSMAGMIEGVLALYFFLAVYAWLLYFRPIGKADHGPPLEARMEPAAPSPSPLAQLSLMGWMAGSAAACKYPSVVFLVLPLGLLASYAAWSRRRPLLIVGYGLAVIAACGLWYGKNAALTGNPTYPLAYGVFGGATRTPAKDRQWKQAHQVPPNAQGQRYTPAQALEAVRLVLWRSDWLSPLLWPLVLLGLTRCGRRFPLPWLLGGVLFVLVTWWLFTHRIDRFFIPAFSLAALIGGAGAASVKTRGWRWLVHAFLILGLVYCFTLSYARSVGDTRFLVSLQELRRDEPHPDDPDFFQTHVAHRYLNQHVPPGYRVLLVGDAQPFDLEMPVLYNTCFDDCGLEQLLKGKSRNERLAALRAHRISHVFVYWHELDRYRLPGNYGYSDYVTRELVRQELVAQQQILQPVPLPLDPSNGELFEVRGWREGDRPVPLSSDD